MQTGLECIGDVGIYDLFEVIMLAAKSLASISENYVLEISHMGILSGLLDGIGASEAFGAEIARCVKEKNAHEIARIGEKYGIPAEKTAPLSKFIGIYGTPDEVIKKLTTLCTEAASVSALKTLKELSELLCGTEEAKKIRFDFSVVNDMNYYSGIVLSGFIEGICESVLSGGQYGKLMEKMGRSSDAIGFAIYLDLLSGLDGDRLKYDVDVLLIADENADAERIISAVERIRGEGKSVSVQSAIPEKLRYKELLRL